MSLFKPILFSLFILFLISQSSLFGKNKKEQESNRNNPKDIIGSEKQILKKDLKKSSLGIERFPENKVHKDFIVLVVDTKVFTFYDLKQLLSLNLKDASQVQNLFIKDEEFRNKSLELLETRTVILEQAQRLNIIPDEGLQTELRDFLGKFGGEEGYKAFLKKQGLKEKDVFNFIVENNKINQLISNKKPDEIQSWLKNIKKSFSIRKYNNQGRLILIP